MSSSKKKAERKAMLAARYEPLSNFMKPSDDKSSSSSSTSKHIHSDSVNIPKVLKKNSASLSDSAESVKLTDFGKSCLETDIYYSPPTKKAHLEKSSGGNNNFSRKIENKRLSSLQNDPKQLALLSSPSMFDVPKSSKLKFPIEHQQQPKKTDLKHNDVFDNLKHKSFQEIKDNKQNKAEKLIEVKQVVANTPKKEEDKMKSCEKSVKISKNVDISKTGDNILDNYKNSLENFKQMLDGVKSINEQIAMFRKKLCESSAAASTPVD